MYSIMAKPRKQRSEEQKLESSGGVVLHQKLCISVDMENRRIYGHTEMKVVVPASGDIALHADNMVISNITVDGQHAEFEYFPHYQFVDIESSLCSVSCSKSAADVACSTYISSLSKETSPNLIITYCNNSKETQNNLEENVPENIIQNSSAEQVVNGCNGDIDDKDVKIICIDYLLEKTETGIHFGENILHTDNQIRRAHCWFPCMYMFTQHCSFDLEFTVSSKFVAVSNGELLNQVLSNDDPPRKTFFYKLNVPVSAGWISLAVAPFEVVLDKDIGIVSHMCLSSDLQKLQNTVGFFHNAFSYYEDYLSTSFPFGSYKQVFVPPELSTSTVNIGASMCLFSSQLLFDEKVIDQTIETRIKLAYALSRQWFGIYIIAEDPNDEWLLDGLAGFLTDSFIKRFLGNNEARYRRYKDNCAVCKADTCGATSLSCDAACNLYGTQSIGLYGNIRSWKAVAVLQMLEKQMGPDSFRKILQSIVYRTPDANRSTRTLSTKEFRHLANKVGNLERPFLKEFFPRWIESCGCPLLRMGLSYNKRRNMVELAVLRGCTVKVGPVSCLPQCNENQDSDVGWPGMMSIRVHELDGMYDHPILPMSGDSCQLLEIQCHSKIAAKKIQKSKKGLKADGSDDNADTAPSQDMRTSVDSPLLWVRVDPEMEYLSEVHFHQPIQMWINQLEKEKDVIAQAQAIEALKNLPQFAFSVNALNNFLCDSKAFWRVRIEAAYALAHSTSEESDCIGLDHLIKFYKSRRYDVATQLPRPNDFHDVPEYFVLEAIPQAVAMVRAADNKSPREAVEFLLELLKYNDNNGNPYSDIYWLCTLVHSIGELEFSQQSSSLLASLLKCVDKLLQFDSIMPSYGGILTISCLQTLVRVALKMTPSVRMDHVCELIRPFRNVDKSTWKVRIEASKAILDLAYNCKGLDAAVCLFDKFIVEEPSIRGQTKLSMHLMQLCQMKSESESNGAVSCATLVALLRLLASKMAFNNVFLRHYLFCILQIVAGRLPTLYGLTKVKENQVAAVESLDEQPTRSASLKLNITRTQEVLADTPNLSVDAPAIPKSTKEDDTVSNCSEGRMNILKIRVKQPASSCKGSADQVPDQSRIAPIDTDLGHSSSVSVDAPMKGVFELSCTSNQNIEEVYSSCEQESRMKLLIKDEATANSSNALGDGLSPVSSRKDEGTFALRSTCNQSVSVSKPADLQPVLMDYLDGKRKRKREKKDKERTKKLMDKDGERRHSNDLEYLERKRQKKERKQMEKRMARMQQKESRTASELQDTQEPLTSRRHASLGDLKKFEASGMHVSKSTEPATDVLQASKGTKIKIKIRNKSGGIS